MNEASRIAYQIKSLILNLKGGTLRFYGDWFGRPGDNFHIIINAFNEENCLIVNFEYGETLRIWDPMEFNGDKNTFKISKASRVLWEWYYYGRPQIAENLYYFEYINQGSNIVAKTNVDWYTPDLKPSANYSAVEIL